MIAKRSVNEAINIIAEFDEPAIVLKPDGVTAREQVEMSKTVFLFPGQGAQKVGMAKELVESQPAARGLFDEAKGILGYDLLDVCINGPVERLNATDISQPAIFVSSIAALEALRASEPAVFEECFATAGLSLGEYTALVLAGVMTFADGLRLVDIRGRAMQAAAEANRSAMTSVISLGVPEVEEMVQQVNAEAGRQTVWVANLLCPGNTVVSGTIPGIEAVEKLVEGKGAKFSRLAVAGAFHTDLMKPADEKLAAALKGMELKTARIPVWSNVDARPHTDPEEIRELLVRQVLQPVRWEETLRNLLEAGAERFYEIGPGKVLAGLLKRVNRKMECRNCPA